MFRWRRDAGEHVDDRSLVGILDRIGYEYPKGSHQGEIRKRLVDFLLEIDVDMAEFSILTPFPHTPVTKQFEEEDRILHRDWKRYNTAEVVYKPKHMTPDELQEMYHYAWDVFYQDMSQSLRMSRLFMQVVHAEIADSSYQPTLRLNERRQWHS